MEDRVAAVPAAAEAPRLQFALLVSVFIVAACGLAYELIAGALASYLLGDSVTQFSTVIGAYLFAMGVGSWLSKYIRRDLVARFVQIEIAVGLLGGSPRRGCFSPSPPTPGHFACCSTARCSRSACWLGWKSLW